MDPLVSDSDLDSSAGVVSLVESFVAVGSEAGVGFVFTPWLLPASSEDILDSLQILFYQ